jgi:hypothetical protein
VSHHTSNQVARSLAKGAAPDSSMGRGGGVLADAARSCLLVALRRGVVTLTNTKNTRAPEGQSIVWRPVDVPELGCARLEPMTTAEHARPDVEVLCAWLGGRKGGCVRSGFKKKQLPPGLSAARAEAALNTAIALERVVERKEPRGSNKNTSVYYLAE